MVNVSLLNSLSFVSCLSFVSLLSLANLSWSQINPRYRIDKLPGSINSPYEEIKPISSIDGDTLYFIRAHYPQNIGGKFTEEDIWFTYRSSDDNWKKPTNKIGGINDAGANIFAGVSPVSDIIYIINYSMIGNRRFIGISAKSIKPGSVARKIIDQKQSIEIDDDFHDFYLNPEEKVLLISMKTINTLGLEDIYISIKDGNNNWSKPVNLGVPINSRGFEISPYLSNDGTILYFASNGHNGFGDADIFYARRQDDSWVNWSIPENMGQPFNSSKFDAYLSKNKKGDFFIASNRKSKFSDIYKVSKNVTDSNAFNASINTAFSLDEDVNSTASQKLTLDDSNSKFEKLVLLFDFDKSDLSHKESKKLNLLISEILIHHINRKIYINGYTDDEGSENYNRKLSLRRAKAISKILRKAGVERNLISVKGNGIYPISANHEIKRNEMRRVEISLSAID